MNKTEFVAAVAESAELSKSDALKAVNALIEIITKAIAQGDTVSLVGFGSFKSTARAARIGKNPRTGEKLKISAKTAPKFTPGAPFKAAVAAAKRSKKKAK